MKVVGLTGGIASGKSTVSHLLQQEGLKIIDCDAIAHAVTIKGAWGYRRVVSAFGRDILLPTGEIDRKVLGDLVFADAAARRRLNKATHLPVAVGILKQLIWHWLCCRLVVVLDMPLLMETGTHKLTHPVVLVACSPDVQLGRLTGRDSCSRDAAAARIASQMPLSSKLRLADVVLTNDGTLQELQQQVTEVVPGLKSKTWPSVLTSPPALLLGACLLRGAVSLW